MANVPKLGQFGHTFKRGMEIVQTVEQRTHTSGERTMNMWKNLSLFVAFPLLALSAINCAIRHKEDHNDEHPEFIAYPYMKIMNKPYPWGDGKHTLFHNPKKNYIPGIGFEA